MLARVVHLPHAGNMLCVLQHDRDFFTGVQKLRHGLRGIVIAMLRWMRGVHHRTLVGVRAVRVETTPVVNVGLDRAKMALVGMIGTNTGSG